MTLQDKIYSLAQHATADLRINGVRITNWIAMRGGDSDDNPVPFLDVDVPDYSMWTRGLNVTLDAGYDTDQMRLFTGGLFARGDEDPDALRTQCFVRGRTDDAGVTISETASVINPPVVWPRIPAGQYIDFEISDSLIWEPSNAIEIATRELVAQANVPRRPAGTPLRQTVHCLGDLKGAYRSYKIPARDLSGQMMKTAMAGILADSGVGAWTFDFDDYQLAPSGVKIDRAPGAQGLNLLMTLRGLRARQLRSGNVLFKEVTEKPAITPAFSYKSTDVSLAFVIDNPGEVKVPFNPLLQRGQTIEIVDEATQVSGMWYLRGHHWELGENGDWSYMDLIGGEDLGTSIGVNPTASFVYTVELEYIGGDLYAIVRFDASSSSDPDGTLADADISWTDNQASHKISGTGFHKMVVVKVSDLVPPWIVTETATDATTLTGTEDQTIVTDVGGSGVYMPALGVAADTQSMFSPDSANTWRDNAESQCTAVGLRPADGIHSGHALYGFDDGHLELTRDGNQTRTTVMPAVGERIVCIAWDWRNTLTAWALTENCKLYASITMDDASPTFVLYDDLRTKLGLAGAFSVKGPIGLPAGQFGGYGGVWVYGGTGTGWPLSVYDAVGDHHWVLQTPLGDLLADGPGSNDLAIYDATAPGDGHTTIVLTNCGGRLNGSVPIYDTVSPGGPTATWVRATGLTAGLVNGRAMLANAPLAPTVRIAIFDDRDAWKSTDHIAYAKTANVLPSGFQCHKAMYVGNVLTGLPDFDGVYVLALENAGTTGGVYKSTDELNSEVKPLRDSASDDPWDSGCKALDLSIGAPTTTAPQPGDVVLVSSGGTVYEAHLPPGGTAYVKTDIHTELGSPDTPRIRCLTTTVWVAMGTDKTVAAVTLDAGGSWTQFGTPAGASTYDYWRDICMDAGGRVWAFTNDRHDFTVRSAVTVYYSDDFLTAGAAATWTQSYIATAVYPPSWVGAYYSIKAHPTNPGKIYVFGSSAAPANHGHIALLKTGDRGASWSIALSASDYDCSDTSGNNSNCQAMILASGRIVLVHVKDYPTGYWAVSFTDDEGASWTVAAHIASNNLGTIMIVGEPCGGSTIYIVETHMAAGTSNDQWVWESSDAAAHWTKWTNPIPTGSTGADPVAGGIAYAPTTGALYFWIGGSVRALQLPSPNAAAIAGDYVDITDNLATAPALAPGQSHQQQIAVAP